MMRRLIFVLALFSGSAVYAQTSYTVTYQDTIEISWDQPTTRINGRSLDPITEIKQYGIWFRELQKSWNDPHAMVLYAPPTDSSRAVKSYVANLATGQYEFVVTAIDTAGVESGPSESVILKIIGQAAPPRNP
ncbi:MAG: hypothetical protein ACE5I1_11890 [bacterium]